MLFSSHWDETMFSLFFIRSMSSKLCTWNHRSSLMEHVLKTSYYLIIILEKQFWRQKSSSGIFNICLILSTFWGPPLPMTHWKREQLITTWDKLIITWDWTTLAICLFTLSDYYIPQMHLHFIRRTTSEYSQAIITHLSCTVWPRLW